MFDEFTLIRQIQEFFGPGGKPFFWTFNTLWGLDLATRLPAVIFWLGGRRIGYRAGLFAAITGPIIIYSKWVIAQPRPFYVSDAFTPYKCSTGLGMPSGNALGIATLMGAIAWYARRRWVWIVSAVMILCVGLARVYYGVHSPSQVGWGWLVGLAVAALLIRLADPFARWFGGRSLAFQVGLVALLSAGVVGCGVAIDHLVLQDFETPAGWAERYEEIALATDEEDAFTLFNAYDSWAFGGYLLGFGLAGICLLRRVVPEVETKAGKAVNVAVGVGLYYAYGWLLSAVARPVYQVISFEAYLILALAITPLLIYVGTPWVTTRLLALLYSADDPASGAGWRS